MPAGRIYKFNENMYNESFEDIKTLDLLEIQEKIDKLKTICQQDTTRLKELEFFIRAKHSLLKYFKELDELKKKYADTYSSML